MSVLIKGMEMPFGCIECEILDWRPRKKNYKCPITGREIDNSTLEWHGILMDCPLVEISQHGRLIDADALLLKLLTAESGKVYDYCYPCKEVLQAIKDSPTIIERETN